jgi:hypothetical protein
MSQKFILAGVGTIQLFNHGTGDLIVTSKTLTESGISFTVTAEEIRGGLANKLLGLYQHDSGMSLKMTDSLFSLSYLALNVGGTINVGGDVMTNEQVTTTVANQITVSETPKDFASLGTIGWYSVAGEDNWTKITFSGKVANVTSLPIGSTVCVKYMKEDATMEQFTVSSAFIPSQCYALLTLPLFKAGTDNTTSYTSSSKVGDVQIEIPNFILDGAQELSLTASGASTTALSGKALATFDGTEGCNGDGYYGKIKQIVFNKDEFGDVQNIVIADSAIDLAATETQTLQVYAVYGAGIAPKLIDNSKLTFASDTTATATVSTAGVVTAVANGKAVITVNVTSKTKLEAKCAVVVS